jgi:hypothetical protein
LAKYVFVISPQYPNLYSLLAHDYRGDPVVEVVLDRRTAERRIAAMSPPGAQRDRRRGQRRTIPCSHSDLAPLGYVLIRVQSDRPVPAE